jgi:hypothetical protein
VPLDVLVRVVMHVAFLVAILALLQIRAAGPLPDPPCCFDDPLREDSCRCALPRRSRSVVVATFCHDPSLRLAAPDSRVKTTRASQPGSNQNSGYDHYDVITEFFGLHEGGVKSE